MSPPNRLAAAQEAATQFVDDLTPGVNLGIVSFAGIATVLVCPTTDRAPAKQAIAGAEARRADRHRRSDHLRLQTIDRSPRRISGDGSDGPRRRPASC